MAKKLFIVIGLALTVILDTVIQLQWKYLVATLPASGAPIPFFLAALRQPFFLVMVAVGIFQLINWLLVLERVDLSFAKPFAALSYVTVFLASAWLFRDPISPLKSLGVAGVLVGVWLLCSGEARAKRAA